MSDKSLAALIDDFDRVRVDLQITRLQLAITFLLRADSADDAEIARRNVYKARNSLAAVKEALEMLTPSAPQQLEINQLVTQLDHRLRRFSLDTRGKTEFWQMFWLAGRQ